MRKFIKSSKKPYIILSIILILIIGSLIWIEIRIGFHNLPLNKISGTVVSVQPPQNSDNTTELYIKLDDPSSWPECEYAYAHYNIKDIKEGDKIYLLCSDWIVQTLPPYLSVYFAWKK